MATFDITIGKYIPSYVNIINSIIDDSCLDATWDYPIGVQDDSTPDSSIQFLIGNYTGAPKKLLHIKNITATDTTFYLEYSGQEKTGDPAFAINIEGVADGGSIPLLFLVSSITKNEQTATRTVTFDFAIEDIYGNIEEYITTSIPQNITKCPTPPAPVITNYCTGSHDCGTYEPTSHHITVTLPPGENLYMRLHTTVKGLGTGSFICRRYENQNCSTQLFAPYNVVTGVTIRDVGDYKYATYQIPPSTTSLTFQPSNVVHLAMFLCLNRMYGQDSTKTNAHTQVLDILDAPGVDGNVIYTVTMTESRPGVDN